MTNPIVPVPAPKPQFSKSIPIPAGDGAIELTGTDDSAVQNALLQDKPFPTDHDVTLGTIDVHAQAGKDIAIGPPGANVSFTASGGGFAAIGVFPHSDSAVKALAFEEALALSIPDRADSNNLVLQWGIDASASANGSVALGPVPVTFGAQAGLHRAFAVVHQAKNTQTALTALAELTKSWTVPLAITTANDVQPRTWIVSDVDASVALSLGTNYGYNFHWVREAEAAGLKGDIGLKLQAGFSAVLGFSASGAFSLVVSRPDESPKIRVQVFRQRKSTVSFAMDLGVEAQASTGPFLTKEGFDQIIAAALGMHHKQIIEDIRAIQDFSDGQPLSGVFQRLGAPYVKQLFERLGKTPAAQTFEGFRQNIKTFLTTWGGLDQRITSLLWDATRKGVPVDDIAAVTHAIATADVDSYRELLNKFLPQSGFLLTPTGQWLEALALNKLVSTLNSNADAQAAIDAAKQADALLDTKSGPAQVLASLHDLVDNKLGLQKIIDVVDQASLDNLEKLALGKVADFLDQDVANLDSVKKATEIIRTLRAKEESFRQKALEILERKYEAKLSVTYQGSDTNTALIDAEFDFSTANPSAAMKSAIRGSFTDLLLKPIDGVTLNNGKLSHEMERTTHIDLMLPYYSFKSNRLSQSVAAITSASDLSGSFRSIAVRYQGDASDDVSKLVNFGGSNSHFSISCSLPPVANNQVRVHDDTIKFSYEFRQARANMRTASIRSEIRPYAELYCSKAVKGSAFDTYVKALTAGGPATDRLGDVLVDLRLAYSSDIFGGWLKAPQKMDNPVYATLSIELQKEMRRLIPFFYLAKKDAYDNFQSTWALLVYQSMPCATSTVNKQSNSKETVDGIYWNWRDPAIFQGMIHHPLTHSQLEAALRVQSQQIAGQNVPNAREFMPDRADDAIKVASSDLGLNLVTGLIATEAQIVRKVVDAGTNIAKFAATNNSRPAEAVKALAKFQLEVTQAFNGDLQTLFGGDAVRSIGSALLCRTAATLNLAVSEPDALLEVMTVKPGAGYDIKGFVAGTRPGKNQITTHQAIVNV